MRRWLSSVVSPLLLSAAAVHLTYATTFGVKRNAHSGIVQSQVVLDDLFR